MREPTEAIIINPVTISSMPAISLGTSYYDEKYYFDGTDIYACLAAPGTLLNASSWQVEKIDTLNMIMRFAGGHSTFTNPATDLATVKALF